MMPRSLVAILGLALLAACAQAKPAEEQWSKDGATPEDVKRDLYWCSTTRYIREDQRIDPTRRYPHLREVTTTDPECMEKRGYRKSG